MTGNALKITALASLIALSAITGAAQDRPGGPKETMVRVAPQAEGEAI